MKAKKTRARHYVDQRGSELTQEVLKSALTYDPDTGLFTRNVDWHRFKAGSVAGTVGRKGYIYVSVNGWTRVAHRMAWLYMTGAFPTCDIDHINGEKADNRWSNLREAIGSLNSENQRRAHSNNQSGFLGVRRNNRGGWSARIRVKGKLIQIGSFKDPETAHQAYLDAKRKHHKGCTI